MSEFTRAVARAGFSTLNGAVRPLVRRGVGSPFRVGVGAVIVVTTGRRTGRSREVPLLVTRVGDTLVVSTARRRSDWVCNVEAAPNVRVWVNGVERSGIAEVQRLPQASVVTIRLARREPDDQSRAARSRSSAA